MHLGVACLIIFGLVTGFVASAIHDPSLSPSHTAVIAWIRFAGAMAFWAGLALATHCMSKKPAQLEVQD